MIIKIIGISIIRKKKKTKNQLHHDNMIKFKNFFTKTIIYPFYTITYIIPILRTVSFR